MRHCRINILFMLPNFDTGGSEKLVMDIIKSIDKDRFSPVLAVFFTGAYESEYLKLGLPFYVIHREGIRSKFSTFLFLRNIMTAHKIQVVNTHHTSPLIQGFFPCKVFSKAALVHTEHSKLCYDPKIHRKALFLEKMFLKKADAVVGISKGVCDYFRQDLDVPDRKLRLIFNGIELERFKLKDFRRAEYRRGIGVEDDELAIGLFANFRPEKNHLLLIKAFSLLRKKGKKLKLILCGGGPVEAQAKETAKALGLEGSVAFLGVRRDIPELMNSVDLYCLPSKYEGMPFSALEAMASRVAVVATDVTGNNEIIENNINGVLAAPESPEALAQGLRLLINDSVLRKKIGDCGHKFVSDFSFSKMMDNYEALFSGLAESF